MGVRARAAAYLLAIVAGVLGYSGRPFAQGAANGVDCSKPAAPASNDWMNQTFDSGGAKATVLVTVTGDQVVVRQSIGAIWTSYTFKAQDIKSVDEGQNEDGVVGITIQATPFQFANNTGGTTPPPGVTAAIVEYPSELVAPVIAGFKSLQQRAACGH
jgi:hypothetical protein